MSGRAGLIAEHMPRPAPEMTLKRCTTPEQVLAVLDVSPHDGAGYALVTLRAIEKWARAKACDFTEGDTVRIVDGFSAADSSGWGCYREALAPGATGQVTEIGFNAAWDYWYAAVTLDRCWSVHDRGNGEHIRFWCGRIADTPEGMKPPYKDERKVFHLPVEWLVPVDERETADA